MYKLFIFPHSHFCEKARWALDYKKVPYSPKPLVPVLHIITNKLRLAPGTSVPLLTKKRTSIQGSSQIIDYLDSKYPQHSLTPQSESKKGRATRFELKMDILLGKSIRIILYNLLLKYPDFIQACFTYEMNNFSKNAYKVISPIMRKKIYQTYVKSESNVEVAKTNFAIGMSEVDNIVSQNKFIVGDSFSRADITVASMLSLIVNPKEHPFPWASTPIPCNETNLFVEKYSESAAFKWTKDIYSKYRLI